MSLTAKHLLWVDIETTGLPAAREGLIDFRDVHLMEVGLILTDTAFNILPAGGYTEVVKMNSRMADALRRSDEVRIMHVESGLIAASIAATSTAEDVDHEIAELLTEAGIEKGDVAMAGSGVAGFDLPFVKAKMPLTAEWLTYYSYDVGIMRRMLAGMAGHQIVNANLASYGDAKLHRALEDIKAHLAEAVSMRDWIRSIDPEAPK